MPSELRRWMEQLDVEVQELSRRIGVTPSGVEERLEGAIEIPGHPTTRT